MTILNQITDAIRAELASQARPSRPEPTREQIESDLAVITRCRHPERKQDFQLELFLKITKNQNSFFLSNIREAIEKRPPLNT